MPQRGAWTADITVATDGDIGPDIVIDEAFHGFAYRSTVYGASTSLRVVGGAGGLRNVIAAKGYQIAPAIQVAQDIASDCGEALAPSAALSGLLTHWARPKGPAERALTQLADYLGVLWRITPSGEILFTEDLFLPVDTEGLPLNYVGSDGFIELGVDEIDHALLPGITFDDRKVYGVSHGFGAAGLRTTLFFDGDGDRIRGTLRKIVESSLPSDALRSVYDGRLVAQAGSALDFVPDSDVVPGMQRVPLTLGIPGLAVTIAPGARCAIGFYGADGSKPYAGGFQSGSLLTYSLTCPSVQIGAASATPVAHAIEALAGMQAIAAPLAGIHAAVAAGVPATPVTNGTLAAFLAPLAAIPAAVSGVTATMPTLTTRIA